MNGVQLHMGNVESRGDASSKTRLTGTSVSDNGHAPHPAMMAERLGVTVDAAAGRVDETLPDRGRNLAPQRLLSPDGFSSRRYKGQIT